MTQQRGTLFVISGPSGAGKTSLIQAALAKLADMYDIEPVVACTTKSPRPGDINGRDFHFISESQFKAMIVADQLLEWSDAYGAYYGTPRAVLDRLAAGVSCVVTADRAGARIIYEKCPHAVLIWVTVKNLDVLKTRLIARNADSQKSIERRLALAAQEIAQEADQQLYQHQVVNENFDDCLQKFMALLIAHLGGF